jgi:hypothetical protein
MRKHKASFIACSVCIVTVLALMPIEGSYVESTAEAQGVLTVLNPMAQQKPEWNIQPLVPRPATLSGKTVYLINVRWGGTEAQEPTLLAIKAGLEKMVPDIKIVYKLKTGDYFYNDPDTWKEVAAKGDAAIVGVGH